VKPTWHVETADNLLFLPTLPENLVDAVVTDPPYGLSKEPDIVKVLTCWLAGEPYRHSGGGFMGKEWDAFVPGPETWREVFRVLKPGGHLLCFAGTRTHDLMGISLRLAGFEIRDEIVAWLYGSGFPKSLDVSKALDKAAGAERDKVSGGRGPASTAARCQLSVAMLDPAHQIDGAEPVTDDAKCWDGWGTALKPAVEPIILARKPLSERNIAANVLRWGVGGINVDGCRVGTDAGYSYPNGPGGNTWRNAFSAGGRSRTSAIATTSTEGRWPPNVVMVHSPSCRQIGERKVRGDKRQGGGTRPGHFYDIGSETGTGGPVSRCHGDADGRETVGEWDCADDCPVAELDRQTADLQGTGNRQISGRGDGYRASSYEVSFQRAVYASDCDGGGGASRFFPTFKYQAKADTAERNIGLPPGERNMHPTCKPVELMQWLCRLVTPPGGLVLDPFTGSGTTGMAALREGFRFLGVEKDPEHAAVARLRIEGDAPLLNAPREPSPRPAATETPQTTLTLFDGD